MALKFLNNGYFAGKVGIGTVSPSQTLEVHSTIKIGESGVTGGRLISADSMIFQIDSDNNSGSSSYRFRTNGTADDGTELMRIQENGKVGIGNTSPDAFLHIGGAPSISAEALIVRGNASGQYAVSIEQDNSSGFGVIIDTDSTDSSDPALKVQNPNGSLLDVRSNGNVGIGTSLPVDRLTIYDSDDNVGVYFQTATSGTSTGDGFRVGLNNSHAFLWNYENTPLSFGTNGSQKATILANGNVGVGTTNPVAKFEVSDGSSSITLQEYTNGAAIFLDGVNGDFTGGDYYHILANGSSYLGLGGYGGGSTPLNIDSVGKVGIGTTSPTFKLHVNSSQTGVTAIGVSNTGSGASRVYLDASNGDFAGSDYMWIGQNNDLSGEIFMAQNSGSFNIKTQPGGTSTTQFTVTQAGNIGIGTTSPSQKLDVVGRTKITQSGDALRINSSDTNGAYATWQNNGSAIGYIGTGYHLWSSPNNIATSLGIRANTRLDLGIQANVHMTILSTGNVGIGTTSPGAKLNVVSTVPTCAIFDTTSSSYGAMNVFKAQGVIKGNAGYNSGSMYFGGEAGVNTIIQANGQTGIYVKGASPHNVGIGTTSPTSKLQVSGDAYVTEEFGQGVAIANKVANYGGEFRTSGASAQIFFGRSGNNIGSGAIGADSNYVFRVWTIPGFSNPFVIKQDGNVGIGTTDPSSFNSRGRNLVVNSNGDTGITISANTTSSSTLLFADAFAGTGGTAAYRGAIEYDHANDSMAFSTSALEKMRITSAGTLVVGATTARSSSVPTRFSVQGGMSEFETSLTNNNDWENSPISILERGNIGTGGNGADKYSPNLNFHWSGRVSNSLWMNSSGHLNYGSYTSAGVPAADGTIKAGNLNIVSTITANLGAFTGQVTGPTPTTSTSFANKAYVDAHGGGLGPFLPLAGGTMDSGAKISFVVPSAGGNFIEINHTGNENWSFGAQSGSGVDDYIDIGINGGTRVMSWHEDGNVGIGTTTPRADSFTRGLTIGNTSDGGAQLVLQENTLAGGWRIFNNGYLGFIANNDERMRIDSAGNVGIGISNPVSYGKFVVQGTGNLINANASSGAATFQLYEGGQGRFAITTLNGSAGAKFELAGSEKIRIDSAGRVGIGLTPNTSNSNLQIKTPDSAYGFDLVGRNAGSNSESQITFWNSNQTTQLAAIFNVADNLGFVTGTSERMRIDSSGRLLINATSTVFSDPLYVNGYAYSTGGWRVGSGSTYVGMIRNNAGKLEINSDTNRDIQFGDAGTPDIMYIDTSAENVGIGTDTPDAKLEIKTDGEVNSFIKLNSTKGTGNIYGLKTNGGNSDVLAIMDITAGNRLAAIGQSEISFATGGTTRLLMNSSGKVGIGTTSPTYKLSVSGGIQAGGVVTYTKAYANLNTTGNAVAGLTASTNGQSAAFTFTCFGHSGGYQKIVYSCYNGGGNWYASKVIDEGTNQLEVAASANSTTITFTFKSRSGTLSYTPRVVIEAIGTAINSTYA
jgi:hypothetical protein